jgi:hypothetical protein
MLTESRFAGLTVLLMGVMSLFRYLGQPRIQMLPGPDIVGVRAAARAWSRHSGIDWSSQASGEVMCHASSLNRRPEAMWAASIFDIWSPSHADLATPHALRKTLLASTLDFMRHHHAPESVASTTAAVKEI